jgi:membrane complex biogenesis BtpA family protein
VAIDRKSRSLIGMLHIPALPGTPGHEAGINQIIDHACAEATTLASLGYHSLLLENMHDLPYLKSAVGPEIVACMTMVAAAVARETNLPLGIQILAAANREALAVAHAASLAFIRAEGFVFGHLADEGYIESCAGPLLRYRKQIDAQAIRIFCDIKKKHASHAITADLSLAETARAAEFFRAEGLIVTGTETGQAPMLEDLIAVRETSTLPLAVGSGVSSENIASFLEIADAVIVGSALKQNGDWTKPIDPARAARLAEASQIAS